ncbi:DHH family phosphoesterase [Halorarius litoreus]|uniref:DHH family phosphoesterase n=1 Tax=Halorarius litoreus TaxID=2962676 RepID=UPI0020CCF91A|nr:DHH family phosphoesterase [Halorarius litoreus]
MSRLVLGCGSVGRRLVISGGNDPALVVTTDEHRVETLRSDAITATLGDPTDPATLADVPFTPDTVIVGSDDPATNIAAARLARETYPDAFLLAFAGHSPVDADIEALESTADTVVDPRNALADFLSASVGEEGLRTRRLRRVIRSIDGPLAVVAHDNPDPDAIASAIALEEIAERAGTPAEACYFGDINHQENRALVNLLEFDLRHLSDEASLDEFGGVALVDHSRPGVNDQLPEDTRIDIVIDHHPPRAPVEARFVDLRSDVGATSTLLTGYLQTLGMEPSPAVATGLLFGIHVDTNDFSREVSTADFEAAAYLMPFVDGATLERIESPSVSPETFDIIGRAITDRETRGSVVLSYVGQIGDRDALAQAADRLLGMDGINTTLVYGSRDDIIYASARSRGGEIDIGETLREAFGQIGSAGGHADMAGAQIPVGALVEEGEENPEQRISEVVTDRFFETLDVGPNTAATAVYANTRYLGEQGPAPSLSKDETED